MFIAAFIGDRCHRKQQMIMITTNYQYSVVTKYRLLYCTCSTLYVTHTWWHLSQLSKQENTESYSGWSFFLLQYMYHVRSRCEDPGENVHTCDVKMLPHWNFKPINKGVVYNSQCLSNCSGLLMVAGSIPTLSNKIII